ncbi:hypothetical protein [Alkalicoccus saliphilus]|uniref:Uncharacterized protein n=1 Tax=Alkalicoccus saliphilus TaxID=200989 RepID=A0A2T4U3U0_9BACI|nr:hypothetical protein [Alkalicoccus saliphilus]PTL38062.1 hypothetical protein C6Y45_13240 [Alkalicoccus saliphilus]
MKVLINVLGFLEKITLITAFLIGFGFIIWAFGQALVWIAFLFGFEHQYTAAILSELHFINAILFTFLLMIYWFESRIDPTSENKGYFVVIIVFWTWLFMILGFSPLLSLLGIVIGLLISQLNIDSKAVIGGIFLFIVSMGYKLWSSELTTGLFSFLQAITNVEIIRGNIIGMPIITIVVGYFIVGYLSRSLAIQEVTAEKEEVKLKQSHNDSSVTSLKETAQEVREPQHLEGTRESTGHSVVRDSSKERTSRDMRTSTEKKNVPNRLFAS